MSWKLGLDFPEFNLWMRNLSARKIYEFDEFRLDADHLMLYNGDNELPVAPKAVETLLALIERSGQIVSKDELLKTVWPDAIVEESNLFAYVSALRKTLGTQKNGKPWVETLRRRGYRFSGDVRVIQTSNHDHSAWIVDSPSQTDHEINFESGRLYLLKDWHRGKSGSISETQSGDNSIAVELADTQAEPEPAISESIQSRGYK